MKRSYNKLDSEDKKRIIDFYYNNKSICFQEISDILEVSARSISRVLQEADINTRLKNRYTLNDRYFDNVDCQEKAYILGFIYADGFVGNEKHNNIVISINDRELLEEISKLLEFTGNLRKTSKGGFENSKEGVSLNFSSSIMAKRLREIEIRAGFKFSKIRNTKTEEIKSLEICAKKEFDYIFEYLYNNSTIKLTRKYEKWNLIKSAFMEKSIKQIR